jgi:chemotaxis protein histidine kinase CheA
MKISAETRELLLNLADSKKVYLEGNLIKVLEVDVDDAEMQIYLEECKRRDSEARKKRLEVTRQVQDQNAELEKAAKQREDLMKEIQEALAESKASQKLAEESKAEAEKLRDEAVENLDDLQRRTQFELMGQIVRVALYVIIGVGVLTTALYVYVLSKEIDSKIIESTWSNLFGILLTNSFSIIGTIMGVKYAAREK